MQPPKGGRETEPAGGGDVTAAAVGDSRSVGDRIDVIEGRLAELRRQTTELSKRASAVTARTRELRSAPSAACNHAREVQEMQTALEVVQHELDGLRTAMRTRGVIEQAKGMLMLHERCDADAAFALLVQLSQTSHRKLIEVAETLVTSWTADGSAPA